MLSVVVPVYNAAEYLPRCLDSLLAQGISDYEIVCVDDGSTDDSGRILLQYQESHPRTIRVVKQSNSGCPAARNAGILAARGDVLTFCDADDYLIPNAYRYLLDTFWYDGLDVLKFNSITLDEYVQRTWVETNDVTGKIVYEGVGHGFYQKAMPYFVWQCLYRRAFLVEHGLRFRSLALCDDTAFCLDVFMANPHTVAVDSNVYRYTIAEGQLTRRRDANTMRRIVDSYLVLFEAMNQYARQYTEMKQTLMLYKEQQMIPCMSRLLSANYGRTDWQMLKSRLRTLEVLPLCQQTSVAWGINVVMNNYVFFMLAGGIYRGIFVPYVLPHLKRN